MLGNTRMNYSPSLHLHCSFYIYQSHPTYFSFAPFRAQGGHCLSWAVDLCFSYSSHLPSCRPAEADEFSVVLSKLHPSTLRVMGLSSQDIFEGWMSYHRFSRFGEGRRWKKWSPGFAVQIEIDPAFLNNLVLYSINPGTRSPGFRNHGAFLQSRTQGVKFGNVKRGESDN